MDMQVFCRSDFAYAQRPKSFRWGGKHLQVDAMITEWFVPEGKCFRVKTITDQLFELFYDSDCDNWQINEVW